MFHVKSPNKTVSTK